MEKMIPVRGRNIQVFVKEHTIKLAGNGELTALLSHETEAATDELVVCIKTAFREMNNREINIADASMAVEIWGHVYADKFATVVQSLSEIGFIDRIAGIVMDRCEVIDIGERGYDDNRFVWDALASFKTMIARLLPKANAGGAAID